VPGVVGALTLKLNVTLEPASAGDGKATEDTCQLALLTGSGEPST
jgi:hypothetical protein